MSDNIMAGFYEGTYQNYKDNSEKYIDGIYFARDKGIIMARGNQYSNAVKNVYIDNATKKLTVSKLDGTTEPIDISISGGGTGVYDSKFGDNINIKTGAVGGISSGISAPNLEGKTYDELFDMLLFPTVNPTFVSPSATLTYSGNTTVIVGSSAPAQSAFSTLFNKGSINIGTTKQADRAGEKTSDSINRSGTGSFSRNIELGNNNYTYTVNYGQGPQPLNSKGENAGDPYPAGSVTSNTITINGTYPCYASIQGKADINNPTVEMPLISWNGTSGGMYTGADGFTLEATENLPQVIKIPNKLSNNSDRYITSMEIDSPFGWQIVANMNTTWDISSEEINGITYKVYTYNGSRDAAKLRIHF